MLRAKDAIPNVKLFNLRDGAGLTQQELAERLNHRHLDETGEFGALTGNTVSRWESGRIERPAAIWRRLLAQLFDVSIEELGFTRPRTAPASDDPSSGFDILDGLSIEEIVVDPRVDADQEQWRQTRRSLNSHRFELSSTATRLYEPARRLAGTGLLAPPEWIPQQPVDLAAIDLVHDADAPPAAATGGEAQSANVRPLASLARRYQRYSHAVRDLDQPRLFENRLGYRLVDVDWGDRCEMTFGYTTYFEVVDIYEALAHEMALTHVRADGQVAGPSSRRLAFRRLFGDPFDLSARPVMPAIDTLTIRRGSQGSPSMVLHRRDSAHVSVAGGLLHVMPAGMFQPSSVLPAAQRADFDLWRNIMREYAEEFLGHDEHEGDGAPIDYATVEPFATLDGARREGRIRLFCLGVAVDPLTLAVEILTAAVFDDEVYDAVFADIVTQNSEGVVGNHVPFEEHTIRRLLDPHQHTVAPAAVGCLHLAWEHRKTLLQT